MDESSSNDATCNYMIPKAVLNAALLDNKLNICHINVQSLCARKFSKFEELKHIFLDSKVDVICMTETWLSPAINDTLIAIPGFNLLRHDRNRHGGGICVYYRQNLKCRVLKRSSDQRTEFLIFDVLCGINRILFSVYYNPPNTDCSHTLRCNIEEFGVNYSNSFVIGDFNMDLKKNSRLICNFVDTFESLSYSCVNSEPTFEHVNGCSLLDLFLTDSSNLVLKFNQVAVSGISHHDLIFASLDFHNQIVNPGYFYRDYKNFDRNSLVDAFGYFRLDIFLSINNSDILLNLLNCHLHELHERFFPLKFCEKKSKSWFDLNIQRAMVNRDLAYNIWKNGKNDANRKKYAILRNKVNKMIADAKLISDKRLLATNQPVKQLWSNINKLGLSNRKSQTLNCDHHVNEINDYFASNFTTNDCSHLHLTHSENGFMFRVVDDAEIINAVYDIKSNAAGLDNFPIIFIKNLLPNLLPFLKHLFNTIITSSIFPSNWKKVKVIPIIKKSGDASLTNLRPISILCSLSKVFEKLIRSQINEYINEYNFLHPFQSGFRKHHSTDTALMKVHDDISVAIDKKGIAVLLLIDFAKAFDSVPHKKLINKLVNLYHFSDKAAKLLFDYLTERYQAVFLDGFLSSFQLCESGVPQGSILGPLLFSLFINDLPLVLNFCSVHLFADDVQIYFTTDELYNSADIESKINHDLKSVHAWSVTNSLPINPSKTKALFINKLKVSPDPPSLKIDNSTIPFVENASNLGVILTNNLEWNAQINSQCRKIYFSLKQLNISTKHFDSSFKLKLFKSLILPHFIYADFIFSNASGMAVDRLRVALNACVRFVYNLKWYSRVSHLQKNLLGCSFANFYKYRSCVTLHRIINTKKPHYLYTKLTSFNNIRTLNYVIPHHSSTYYGQSFFARGIANWNSLPIEIKRLQSKFTFKQNLLTFLNGMN